MPALHVDDEEFYAPEQGNHTILLWTFLEIFTV